MRSGITGRIIGDLISDKLKRKYGNRKAILIEGIVSLSMALIFLIIYIMLFPTLTEQSLIVTELTAFEVNLKTSGRKTDIYISERDRKYSINYGRWRERYSTNELLNALRQSKKISIWLKSKNDSNIFGLRTENVEIPPSVGLNLYMTNRASLLWLIIFFGVAGIGTLIYGRFIKTNVDAA
ncbi:MAG: hypothetical protein WDA22_17490 [Bacteroidota bacterium]